MGDKNRPMIRMRYIKKKLNCHLEYVLFGFFTFHKFSFSVIKKIMLTCRVSNNEKLRPMIL